MSRFLELANGAFGPDTINVLINPEETAAYLAKKFGIPDNLVRDEQEREQILCINAANAAKSGASTTTYGVILTKKINVGVDGIQRPQEKDQQISENIASLFGSATGQAVLNI